MIKASLLNQWDTNNKLAIKSLRNLIESSTIASDFKEEKFLKLTDFILTTTANSHSFMPLGFEDSIDSPITTNQFISMLHHNMVDDGDVCFVKFDDNIISSFMLFKNPGDVFDIEKEINERFSFLSLGLPNWTVHVNVDLFISDVKFKAEKIDFVYDSMNDSMDFVE